MPKKILDCFHIPAEMACMFSLALGEPLSFPDAGFDWERFFAFTEKNRLETLCAAEAAKLPDKPEQLDRLKLQARWLTDRTMKQIQLLAFLVADFKQAGIRVLSMKGPLLAAELYGDPSLRQSNDLDLLVCETDYEAAKERLLSLGFVEHSPLDQQTQKQKKIHHKLGEDMHGIFLKNGLCVELHWRISFRYPVDFEDLWENREEKMLLGQSIFCLGRIDNLVYLICHAAGHGYSRMRWLIDLYKLFTEGNVNYTELYLAMKQRNCEVFLLETLLLLYLIPSFRMPAISNEYFSLRHEDSLVHYKFHENIRTAALRACQLTELLEPLIFRSQDPSGIPERNYMHMLPVVGKKVTVFTYIQKLMLPKRAELERFHFPNSLYFLYYIVRPFYKLWRCTPFYKGIYK